MNIGVIGLGLIGGSLCKAIKKNTAHTVYGTARSEETINKALLAGAIDAVLNCDTLPTCDLVIVALYPQAAIDYVKTHAGCIKKGALVIDCGGVKKKICDALAPIAEEHGFTFIGAHPMAGREKSGFDATTDTLFCGASLIIMRPLPKEIEDLFSSVGFSRFTLSTPEHHDDIIAFTSQLAHVVSNAYVRSPLALSHSGFSAGSFKDMTRVAYLNEDMWTELFLENKDALAHQIGELISRLCEYKTAIENEDETTLRSILKEGKEIKVKSDEPEVQ